MKLGSNQNSYSLVIIANMKFICNGYNYIIAMHAKIAKIKMLNL